MNPILLLAGVSRAAAAASVSEADRAGHVVHDAADAGTGGWIVRRPLGIRGKQRRA